MENILQLLNNSFLFKNFRKNIETEQSQCVSGLTDGEKSLLLLNINKGIIFCDNLISFSSFSETLKNYNKNYGTISGIDESLFLSDLEDKSLSYNLITNILNLLLGKIDYLLTTSIICMQRLPKREQILSSYFTISQDENYGYKRFITRLIELGYKRCDKIETKGEFSVKGDIVDVFEIQNDEILRINFFDDQVENITLISDETEAIKTFKTYDFYPTSFSAICEKDLIQIKEQLLLDLKNTKLKGADLLNLQSTISQALERLEKNELNSFFNCYLNLNENIFTIFNDVNIIIDEPKNNIDTLNFLYNSNINSIFDLITKGALLNSHLTYFIRPEEAYNINRNKLIIFENIKYNNELFICKNNYNAKILGSQKYIFNFQLLEKDLKMLIKNNKVVLFCSNQINYDLMAEFLLKHGLSYHDLDCATNFDATIYLSREPFVLSASFLDGGIIVIGSGDLFKKDKKVILPTKNKKGVFYLPKPGEMVVHSVHGIGKCIKLEKLKLSGSEKDYFIIEYAGGDILYVPSEQANLISAYTGSDNEPRLNKLGGAEFAKIKERVKNSVKALAVDLLKLYSEREALKGFKYSEDNYLMQAFEDAFEFEETDDQLSAIAEIKKDMTSGKVMDRLICGDVGFGKTEVALRAIYKAVIDGKQVAFLCPTSILSQQHYQTCLKRFDGFMVNVAVLNRLRTKQQQEQIIKEVRDGKINVICGTHRLLSKDIEFNNLGLLVLDEEQRFGVEDKEKIKNIKKQIDVLSLSATPIPRTLHMSLSGIRDISIIETPPKNRLPVQTYVSEFSMTLLVDACNRELSRGGQVLVVYNRVETILSFANELRANLPNVSIGIAHGQMNERELENAIVKLYNREYQIIVATTLIENGVDLPLANTLFVVDSDKLGLSQLYQLRGRIGRSNRLAYAYFSYDPSKVLTEDAYKRLSALMEYTELGSGFKIAMRDLEIRGAGNVLGKEQHGHMEKVGYDMYSKLLKEAVADLKGDKVKEKLPIKMDIDIPAFISADYIYDEQQRIKIYTTISELASNEDLFKLKESLVEAFGPMPLEVENILKIGLIKNLAQNLNVKRIIINANISELQLYKTEDIINEKTAKVISDYNELCVLKFEDLPIIKFNMPKETIIKKVDKIISFLIDASF